MVSLFCFLFCNFLIVFEDCKPVQEEREKATGNDHHVNSSPEPCDSSADEEEENVTSTEHDASEGEAGHLSGTQIKSYSSEVFLQKCLPFHFPLWATEPSLCSSPS